MDLISDLKSSTGKDLELREHASNLNLVLGGSTRGQLNVLYLPIFQFYSVCMIYTYYIIYATLNVHTVNLSFLLRYSSIYKAINDLSEFLDVVRAFKMYNI